MRKLLVISVTVVPAMATTALAQRGGGYHGWGPRVGLNVNPDQVHFGAHIDLGNLSDRLRLQPNFGVGLGDDVTVGEINFEVNYRFRGRWDVWTPYLGGGLGVLFYDHDNGRRHYDNSDTEFGATFLGGIEKGLASGDRFFLEAKLGLVDTPDLKFLIGWTFWR
ncbi:MAG: hypothetical protein AB1772_09460 [Candidatus Zixiibacteriota bacterium]